MINLFTDVYVDQNSERHKELMSCIEHNEKHGFRVISLIDARITYNEWFAFVNEHSGPDDINILANLDVACFADLSLFEKIHDKTVWALTRYEPTSDGGWAVWERTDSQDVWVWRGQMPQIEGADFRMGVPGCDNRIAYLFEQAGYRVENPSRTIEWRHYHKKNIHNYTQDDRVQPPYKWLWPAELNWIENLPNIKAKVGDSQYEEAAIIDYIFANIGPEWRRFVDIGAGAYDGKMSNTRHLVSKGWRGIGFDCNRCADPWVIREFVTPKNVAHLLNKHAKLFPQIDLLCLDIDSCDFWVLNNILQAQYRPRVIVTEFNGCLPSDKSLVLEYEAGYKWDGTTKYGYSFMAGKKLLEAAGYTIVMNHNEVNIVAIRNDQVNAFVPHIGSKQFIYHPINNNAKFIEF